MAGLISFGKGSKRRVRLVRWRPGERFGFLLVLVAVVMETIFLAWWLMSHSFD